MAQESKGGSAAPAAQAQPAGTPSTQDLLATYSGHGLYRRLQLLAQSKQPEADVALVALLDAIKSEGTNLELYERVCGAAGQPMDDSFVAASAAKAQQEALVLERQLNIATANQVRDNIRTALMAHGEFKYAAGDLQAALKSFVRARDYSSAAAAGQTYLAIVRVCLELKHWSHVDVYANKIRSSAACKEDSVLQAQVSVARGLSHLGRRDFYAAAHALADTTSDLGSTFTAFATMADVAAYLALAALATFSREELKQGLLERKSLRAFWEANALAKTAVEGLVHSEYASCFRSITQLMATLQVDPWVGGNLRHLLVAIRARAMVLYCGPYKTISLTTMASALDMPVANLTSEVAGLIADGRLQFRIDSAKGQLLAKHTDPRTAAYAHAEEVADAFVAKAQGLALKAAFDLHSLSVGPKVPPPKGLAPQQTEGMAGFPGFSAGFM